MKRQELLAELTSRILAVPAPSPVRVAIDGVDGAGKTTLADQLAASLERCGRQVLRASIDGFHHPRGMRYRRGRRSPEGYFHDSFDLETLKTLLLDPLAPGGDRRCRLAAFDYRCDRPVESPEVLAAPDAVLLFDGVFLLRPELVGCWQLKIFVHVGFDVSVERATARDVAGGGDRETLEQLYRERYVAGQRLYLESCRPRRLADVEVDNTDFAAPDIRERPR